MKATIVTQRLRKRNDPIKSRHLSFTPFEYDAYTLSVLRKLIRQNLTPDLLESEYRSYPRPSPMYGYCFVAMEATQLLFDAASAPSMFDNPLLLCRVEIDGNRLRQMGHEGYRFHERHWYLRDRHTGRVIDFTADQYPKGTIPYKRGKPHRRYTFAEQYQWRSIDLMTRVLRDAGCEFSDITIDHASNRQTHNTPGNQLPLEALYA